MSLLRASLLFSQTNDESNHFHLVLELLDSCIPLFFQISSISSMRTSLSHSSLATLYCRFWLSVSFKKTKIREGCMKYWGEWDLNGAKGKRVHTLCFHLCDCWKDLVFSKGLLFEELFLCICVRSLIFWDRGYSI